MEIAEETGTRFLASVCTAPVTVASLLVGLGLIAALLAGLEVNLRPIGAVDSVVRLGVPQSPQSLPLPSFTPVSEYLPAAGPRSAERFLLALPAKAPPSGFVCAETRMAMGGWAADPRQGAPVARVDLYLDRQHSADARVGLPRPDVEEYFQRPDFATSGWVVEVPVRELPTGYHYVEVWAVDRKGGLRLLLELHLHCLASLP